MTRLHMSRVVESRISLRDFLMQECGISRKMLTQLKHEGSIIVNGEPRTVRHDLECGDQVDVLFPPEHPSEQMVPSERPLTILYEDAYVLAVEKPAGIASIPSRLHPRDTLANAVLGYYAQIGLASAIHIVNRLDRDTSGVVLFAKYAYVHHRFSEAQKAGRLMRTYKALVKGEVRPQTIDAPIGRAEGSIMERTVRGDGQHAITHIVSSERRGEYSLLTLRLETGRTHQIRVHLRHLGYPLVGDTMYDGPSGMERHALHSADASFHHPMTGQWMTVTSDVPDDFTID